MSLETDELNQPNDDDAGGRHRRFGFLHADTGVDEDGVDRDDVNADATGDDVDTDDAVNTGTVYDSTGDPVMPFLTPKTGRPEPTFTPTDSEADTTVPGAGGEVVEGEVVEEDVITPDGRVRDGHGGPTTPSTLDDTTP